MGEKEIIVKVADLPAVQELIRAALAVTRAKLRHPGRVDEPELTARVMDLGDALEALVGKPERVTHYLTEDLTDLCETVRPSDGFVTLTPVAEDVTCPACKGRLSDKSHYGAPGTPTPGCGTPYCTAEHHSADDGAPAADAFSDPWAAAHRAGHHAHGGVPDCVLCEHRNADYVRATTSGHHGWIHECGNVDWLPAGHAPADGGCDRCESGSDDASDWKPLYVGGRQ